ncbi:MAG: tRNA (adenosine(37)-N6)-threonylcarbamoyltransferase complex ATPase subunit type 1 TsaE [Chloroflexi bacterium]|nr:tRNA (adenosine(37)-N6)-threonylcarbamoyltransferase complex ATPase subunit type 1 TsaE [Chloroflexota bacterium]MDA1272041.1 tRNA (adenosine(37)-N6)-threonylcarbamoyltransferase complex ATPase subunit type 1 TsaE [Chloroflexota bacterium]PKB59300.1 MAG: tRNA (adenosine(37)-N6)-threonylcarbamoyltransferase complex ATPase subunit type 1 TsaE [SAR202 cluster bacterium Casp-Chloro-G2]
MAEPLHIVSPGPEITQSLGRTIGEQASAGDVILLTGPLGAGKTCLTQGIALGLGVEGYVRSPTFVLMTRHKGRLTLHHVDLYRMGSPAEAWDLGLDEQLLGEGLCVIEWADRAWEIFPEDCLQIDLDYGADAEQRTITVETGVERSDSRFRDLLLLLAKQSAISGA